MKLMKINKIIESDLEKYAEEKRLFALKNKVHIFNSKTKKCIFCGKHFSKINKNIKIQYSKNIWGYGGCSLNKLKSS